MTRLPPLVGRLSRNERALHEAERLRREWVKSEARKSEREKRAELRGDIDAIVATPWFTELTRAEHAAIVSRIRFAK